MMTLLDDASEAAEAVMSLRDPAMQYLTFVLADETYGIDILRVQEIRGWDCVTRVPYTAPFVKGVLNLRGAIVPVVDLRCRFNLPVTDYGTMSVVVVVAVNDGERERVIGMLVDAVRDVVGIYETDLRPAPNFGAKVDTQFIRGLAPIEGAMLMVLDIEQLLSVESMVLSID